MSLLNVLATKNVIRKADIGNIEERAERSGKHVEDILVGMGISSEAILSAKSEYLNVPLRRVSDQNIPFNILNYVPEESAVHYRFAPIGLVEGVLEIGMVDPDDIDARDALNFIASKLGMPYKVFLISPDDFQKLVEEYKGLSGEVTKALSELETELSTDLETLEKEVAVTPGTSGKVETKIIEDAPVKKIVATIIRYATEGNASDIHIEHMRDRVRVRFRVDGVLHTSIILPSSVHQSLVAVIKTLAEMKLDEKRKPQDSRFSAKIEGRKIDFRVSTFPTYYGEKVVMRILDQERGVHSMDEIGLSKRNIEMLRDAIKRPYGIILLSGPTGSGKTTTLYSMLQEINKEEKNVLSLEDPVEYNIEGVSQSQVHPEIGYTFATGLRTTLRQDPDVIMVGEIRDKETAQLAIQAALTGHLVLSTIHTNNAVGVIPRLIDMGVDPYLIAPTLILAIAQRLVSTLSPGSGKAIPIEGSIKKMFDEAFSDLPEQYKKELPKMENVYDPSPTPDSPTGRRGRMAVFEMFKMNQEIERLILAGAEEPAIREAVRRQGMLTMREDALVKASQKKIPFEEVNDFEKGEDIEEMPTESAKAPVVASEVK